jgi:hypothetical protein
MSRDWFNYPYYFLNTLDFGLSDLGHDVCPSLQVTSHVPPFYPGHVDNLIRHLYRNTRHRFYSSD